jgi:SNF2 family DNA or RNA helicase
VVLTTYEIARRDIERLENLRFDIAVFDEAQNVKNIASARAQAMRRVRAEFTLCLTGTPVENHAGEYLAILDLAVPGLFGKPSEFRERLRRDDTLLHRGRPFVLRRTKNAILDELPPKVESDIALDLSPVQKEMYTRATAEVREEVLQAFADKSVQTAGIVALAALTRLRQICVSPAILDRAQTEPAPKFERLSETLTELLEEGHSALVFSQFVRGLDVLGEHLTAQGIGFVRMDGKTPTPKRKEIIARFQSGDGPGVFLVSLRTGGAGLNLTRASYVFHLDPWWNPAVENQASDRAHRIGQTGTVFVQRLLMRHTIEEKMMTLKARKAALFRSICEGAALDGSAGLLTKEDFRFLIDA